MMSIISKKKKYFIFKYLHFLKKLFFFLFLSGKKKITKNIIKKKKITKNIYIF